MTPNDFLLNFPEFKGTDRLLIAAKLNEASARMGGPDQSIWGAYAMPTPATQSGGPTQAGGPTPMTIADMAQGNLAAHYLIISPFGSELRLEPGNGESSYYAKFEELQQAVAGGFAVAGVVV